MIEVMSPGNKDSRHAIRSFLDKVCRIIDAGIHQLVIDVHRPGARDLNGVHDLIWSEIAQEPYSLPANDSLTFVSYAAGKIPEAFVQHGQPDDLLPEMPLFVDPETYVTVNLESTYERAWAELPARWREF